MRNRTILHYRVLLLLAFIAGCVIANELPTIINFRNILILGALPLFFVPRLLVIYIFILLGLVRVFSINPSIDDHIGNYVNRNIVLNSTVVSYPQIKGQEQILLLKPHEIKLEEETISVTKGYVQAKISKYIEINKGDSLTFKTYLEQPENFAEFDYVEYLKSINVYALAKNPSELEINKSHNFADNEITAIRTGIITMVNESLPDPHAKLLAGMLIGTREQFSPEFANNLSISSTTHIVAVSGYNISLVTASILRVSGYINRRTLVYFSYFCLLVFLLIVGLDNLPAFRAGLMGFISLASILLGRRSSGIFALMLIGALMHVQNPFIYKSLSFQLSFSATVGLMLISKPLQKYLTKLIGFNIGEEASTTLTALFVTFPITFSNFGKITVYGLIANLLIAPLIPLITFFGVLFLIIERLLPPLGFLINAILWGSLELMIRIINFIAGLPYADFSYDKNTGEISLAVILLILIFLFESSYRDYIENHD